MKRIDPPHKDNNNADNYFGTVVHKGKKFNYICDINPCTLHSISGKITDLNGDPIFHGSSTGTKFTYALIVHSSGNNFTGIAKTSLFALNDESIIHKKGNTNKKDNIINNKYFIILLITLNMFQI